jgi:chemosensory pili system protein ChpA (sensor histidine kinase/response regulator)
MNLLHDLAALVAAPAASAASADLPGLTDLADRPELPDRPDASGVADAPDDDLSALAWVHDELRRSLEAAHKALRRQLKEAALLSGSDVDAVDPAVLRGARAQLHQVVGALLMIGLPGPARVLQASESAVQRFIARPRLLTREALEAIESASFGVLDYLGRRLAGKALPTLALFPQYRALQQWAGTDRVHPADLWREPRQWQPQGLAASAAPAAADAAARAAMETQVLATMRGPDSAALQRLSELCASLGAAGDDRLAELWKLAAAFYEAQAAGLLSADVYAKRISSRLLAQLRLAIAGQGEVSDRLAQDVLFFCAQAGVPGPEQAAPRLRAVREVYRLDGAAPLDYQALRLGRFDPAWIAQARKRVAAAKEGWSALAASDAPPHGGLNEPFALVGDSLKRLFPSGEVLTQALQRAVAQTQASSQPAPPALAMEVATSLLYLEASLDDAEFEDPAVAARMQRLAQRIRDAGEGGTPQPLEPWIEELYRRVSDRQTMGSVVQELRAALSEVERQIDQYFRDPAQRGLLIPVPAQLQAMRGVLSVLDIDQASHAVMRMSEDVDALASTDIDARHAAELGTFTRLADNLGALSFMIDMLSVQPRMARSLFRYDPASGSLSAVMGRRGQRASAFGELDGANGASAPQLVEQARSLARAAAQPELADEALQQELGRLAQQALLADQRALAQTMSSAQQALQRASDDLQRDQARSALAEAVAELSAPAEAPPLPPPAPLRATAAPQPQQQGSTGLEDDAQMRDIFIEEAREVIGGATEALQRLGRGGDDLADLTLIRRAFHTLKGSSRMVGLQRFGDAAWSCEQLYNALLADSPAPNGELAGFTADALLELGAWVDDIANDNASARDGAALSARADALRQRGAAPSLPPQSAGADELLQHVPDLPGADELQFDLDALPAAAVVTHEPDFVLDLGADDGAMASAALLLPDSAHDGLVPAAQQPGGIGAIESFGSFGSFDIEQGAVPSELPETPEVIAQPLAAEAADVVEALQPAARPDATQPGPACEPAQQAEPLRPSTLAAAAGALAAAPFGQDEPGDAAPAHRATAVPADEQVKLIGHLRIGVPLFNIYLNEADELSRRLCTDLAEWAWQPELGLDEGTVALAHSLAGSSATVGYAELSTLARSLEHALMRTLASGAAADEPQLYVDVAEEMRRLLHQFAAGFLRSVPAALTQRLSDLERGAAVRVPALAAAESHTPDAHARFEPELGRASLTALAPLAPAAAPREHGASAHASGADADDDTDGDIEAVDAIDAELFSIFREEGDELLPQLRSQLREWAQQPDQGAAAAACLRALHTFKGGGRSADGACGCARAAAGPAGQPGGRSQHHPRAHRVRRAARSARRGDLTDNLERLRRQLRDIELQAEPRSPRAWRPPRPRRRPSTRWRWTASPASRSSRA